MAGSAGFVGDRSVDDDDGDLVRGLVEQIGTALEQINAVRMRRGADMLIASLKSDPDLTLCLVDRGGFEGLHELAERSRERVMTVCGIGGRASFTDYRSVSPKESDGGS